MGSSDNKSESEIRREQAEELLLKKKSGKARLQLSDTETLKLIHELEVHQIELEMQNDELILAKKQAEVVADKYTELYEFALTGYYTLSKDGEILALNLAGASMLGKQRMQLKNSRFGFFVSDDTKKTFNLFLTNLFTCKEIETCEVTLSRDGNLPMYVQLQGIITKNDEQCFLLAIDITKHKQAEEKLIAEQNFRNAIESCLTSGIAIVDKEGRQIYVNPSFCRMLDWSEQELIGQTAPYVYWPPEHLRAINEAFQITLAGKAPKEGFELVFVRKDGVLIPVQVIISPFSDGKETLGWLANVMDITKRIHDEQALRESEENYRVLLNGSSYGILAIDIETQRFLFFNPAICELFGHTDEAFQRLSIENLVPKEGLDLAMSEFASQMMGLKSMSLAVPLRKKDGTVFYADIAGAPVILNGRKCSVGFFNDVTERKQAEDALRSSKLLLKSSIESQKDTIFFSIDRNYQYLFFNRVHSDIMKLAYDKDIKEGMNFLECLCSEEDRKVAKENFDRVFLGESYSSVEAFGDVEPVYYEGYYNPIFNDKNEIIGATTTGRDITERIKVDSALKASEKRLSDITSSMADWVWEVDVNGVYTYCSPKVSDILALSPEDIIGKTPFDFMSPDEAQRVATIFSEIASNKLPLKDLENWIIGNDGKKTCLLTNGVPILDKEGNLRGYRGIDKDITERKNIEVFRNQQLLFTTALKEIAEVVIFNEKAEDILENANRIIGETLKLDRALIYNVSFDKNRITGLCEWLKQEHPDIAATKGEYSIEMFLVPFTEIMKTQTYLESHSDAVGEFFKKDESGKILHDHFKIKSLIWYPFAFEEYGYHVFTLNQILEHRKWKEEEIDFLGSAARKISLALMKIKLLKERAETTQELRESEKKHRTILQSAMDGFWQTDLQGRLIEVNGAYCRMSGYSEQELLSMTISDIEVSETSADTSAHMQKVLTQGEDRFETLHRRKDGSCFTVEISVQYQPDAGGRLVAFLRDITDRKKAEDTLREKDVQFRKLSSNLPDLIFQFTRRPDGTYCVPIASEGIKNIFGCSPQDVIEDFTPIGRVIYPEDSERVIKDIEYSAKHLTYFTCEFRVQIPNKPIQWIFSRSTPEKLADGSVTWYGFNANITDMKQTEAEFIKAKEKAEESDRLKSAFLANMSHEIRTPMNGILGFAQLLKEPNLTGKEQQEYIRIIEKSGKRMLNIIHDIVDISKIESGQMEVSISETNINDQIDYIYDFFAPEIEKKGLQLFCKKKLPAIESIIKTDREKIYAILTNLVKNAIKYTNEGLIEIGSVKKGNYLEFFVKDTGIGIAKDRQEAIFERFIQADISNKRAHDGAGLGLSIAEAYVEMLGGKIWVASEEGKGSTFYFTIPYNIEPEEKIAVENIIPSGREENQTKNLKILIAEDDEASEQFITRAIRKYSSKILNANTGVEAIAACRNNADIDLILMDIRMPEMNGYEATRQIREFNKDVIIIAQTAYGLSGDRQKALNAGCNDHISKPINGEELMTLIQKYFNK